MAIVIETGVEARQRLESPAFKAAWDALYCQCPWATPAQSSDFALVWYSIYTERYQPFILAEYDEAGGLIGLLTLAVSRKDGGLTVAGAEQAEYQAWLSSANDTQFIVRALQSLRRALPAQTLQFKYLPPNTPLEAVLQDKRLRGRCSVRSYKRPLLTLAGQEIAESLRKTNTKSKINRLRKLGELKFLCITDLASAKALLPEIQAQYDLRQGAVHDSLSFQSDPCKSRFLLTLLEKTDLLHFTVLTVGGQVAAAQIGMHNAQYAMVGVFSHSPMLARFSPGKIHILFLAQERLEAGNSFLDLTPGDDAWKDRFATNYDEVCVLTIHARRLHAGIHRAAIRGWLYAQKHAPHILTKMQQSRVALDVARRQSPLALLRLNRLPPQRLYKCTPSVCPLSIPCPNIRLNCLEALLLFEPTQAWPDRQAFFQNALQHLEKGESCYTYSSDKRLVACVWRVVHSEAAPASDNTNSPNEESNALTLCDWYLTPQETGHVSLTNIVMQMITQNLCDGNHLALNVLVSPGDEVVEEAIRRLGFLSVKEEASKTTKPWPSKLSLCVLRKRVKS